MSLEPPAVRTAPEGHRWADLARERRRALDASARTARAELGVSAQRPVIMTGHQVSLWHAGVLAKYIAADVVAGETGGDAAWVWVDQDSEAAVAVDYPVTDAAGVLRRASIRLRPDAGADIAVAMLPAARPGPAAISAGTILSSVRSGLERIVNAFAAHSGASSAAEQGQAAITELLAPHGLRPASHVRATTLSSTMIWRELLARMAADPVSMAQSYNAAVAAHPDAGVAPLRIPADPASVELPLWRLAPSMPRARITAGDLASGIQGLAPRALLMTGLLRWLLCDLFIHGTGGAAYDSITERWFRDWLGVTLAPSVMITADLRLPLEGATITVRQVEHARWRAHHIRHDPSMAGDEPGANRKRELVRRIAERRAREEHPLDDYRALQELLLEYRASREPAILAARQEAERTARLLAGRTVASDRAWAFPLHADESLAALRAEIGRLLRGAVECAQ